jgi:hypothetical protein
MPSAITRSSLDTSRSTADINVPRAFFSSLASLSDISGYSEVRMEPHAGVTFVGRFADSKHLVVDYMYPQSFVLFSASLFEKGFDLLGSLCLPTAGVTCHDDQWHCGQVNWIAMAN